MRKSVSFKKSFKKVGRISIAALSVLSLSSLVSPFDYAAEAITLNMIQFEFKSCYLFEHSEKNVSIHFHFPKVARAALHVVPFGPSSNRLPRFMDSHLRCQRVVKRKFKII